MASANGLPPLHLAAMKGDLRSVKQRLALGDNVNSTALIGGDYCTPLTGAVAGGYTNVVECLIEAGADVSPNLPSGPNFLMGAAGLGYRDILKLLIRAGAKIDAADSKDGSVPLHMAARVADERMVEILISAGASVDLEAHDGTTPLMNATKCGHPKCVQALLRAGADASKTDREGWDASYYAAQNGFADVLEVLIKSGAAGNINRLNSRGVTLLMGATSNDHLAAVKLLLRYKADPFVLGAASMTAFLVANDLPVFKALLEGNEARAAAFVDPFKGNTLFHQVVAVGARRPGAFICLLSKAGVNPLVRNNHGQTAAEVARRMGQLDNAKLLDVLEAKYREKESAGTKVCLSTCGAAVEAGDESEASIVGRNTHEYVEKSVSSSSRDEEALKEPDEKALEFISISDSNEEAKVSADVSQHAEVEKQHKKVRPCIHCQNPTHRRCARCRSTFVCSRDCQMATMASHKAACMEIYEERQARKAAAGV